MIEATGAPPSIFLHTCEVYKKMEEEAGREVIEGREALVYTGFVTKLITGPPLNLPLPYFTQVTKALVGMGCTQQIKRGGGTSPSRWLLFRPPTLDLFRSYETKATTAPSKSKTAQLERMIHDLASRVDGLEGMVEELVAALGDNDA